jgi:hypothetical protein
MGVRLPAIPRTAAMMMTFLMMYWPVSVGMRSPDHVIAGSTKSGRAVVIMCKRRRGIATRVALGKRKSRPMNISSRPKVIMNVPKFMNEIVCAKSSSTRGSAGERPRTFRIPNQKKTMKIAQRVTGLAYFLHMLMSVWSMFIEHIVYA